MVNKLEVNEKVAIEEERKSEVVTVAQLADSE